MTPSWRSISAAALVAATGFLLGAAPAGWQWPLPAWVPPPAVPADNPMSPAKVELGRHLFHDTRLSANGAMSGSL